MIIKEMSVRHTDENGAPLYLLRDSKDYTEAEWAQMLRYLKRNAEAKLLKMEVLEK